jgi:hypothetical protein
MNDANPRLPYESKQDFKRRRRFLVLTDGDWEGIKIGLWMLGLLIAGLVLWIFLSSLRYNAS